MPRSAKLKSYLRLLKEARTAADRPKDGPMTYLLSCAEKLKPLKKEADSSSAMTQLERPEVKKESKKVSSKVVFTEREAGAYKEYDVVLIKEGLGNFGDCYYYTKDALKYAANNRVFEGKKSFADHISETEKVDRPERSVKDLIGYHRNVSYKENEFGQGMLIAKCRVPITPAFEWARTLMDMAVDFQESNQGEFIGFSIVAGGDASVMSIDEFLKQPLPAPCKDKLLEAKQMGILQVKPVTIIDDAESVDLVTSAGAGGGLSKDQ